MTNFAGSTQANGFLGAYLKSNGFDGLIIHGSSMEWVYLEIKKGKAQLKDANILLSKDTWETEEIIRQQMGNKRVSTFSIGIAGENKVRFAALVGDKGHVAAHNGIGAVLGSKKLKAISVTQHELMPQMFDRKQVIELGRKMLAYAKTFDAGTRSTWGTASHVTNLYRSGQLPIKNYTTSIWPSYEKFTGQYIRSNFKHRGKPCWACTLHCRFTVVTEGPYAGFEGEELVEDGRGIGQGPGEKGHLGVGALGHFGIEAHPGHADEIGRAHV